MPDFYNDVNGQGLITWGGVASSDYGIVVSEAPAFDKPKRKQTIFNIPGRNGSVLFQEDAFEDVTRSYNVWIAEAITEDSGGVISGDLPERIAAATAWLFSKTGYQKLEDNFEPNYYRLAYYSGGNNFTDELLQYGETTLTFTCRPERFLKSGETAVTVTNGSELDNPTLFSSKPLIYIEGSGSISVEFGNGAITATVTDYIYIDCERLNAYRLPTENKNDQITGTFPNLIPGTNEITITGSATLVKITPNYYTI